MTAAHCYDQKFKNNYSVLAGTADRDDRHAFVTHVNRFILQETFNLAVYSSSDIAIIVLMVIPLPVHGSVLPVGSTGIASGWVEIRNVRIKICFIYLFKIRF